MAVGSHPPAAPTEPASDTFPAQRYSEVDSKYSMRAASFTGKEATAQGEAVGFLVDSIDLRPRNRVSPTPATQRSTVLRR